MYIVQNHIFVVYVMCSLSTKTFDIAFVHFRVGSGGLSMSMKSDDRRMQVFPKVKNLGFPTKFVQIRMDKRLRDHSIMNNVQSGRLL